MTPPAEHHKVLVLGAGVSGIYQIKRLLDLGVDALLLEAEAAPGGTWYRNRYPGARFDSESYTYGYSFSREVLDTWHWKERFSAQPENLAYLNFVVDSFSLSSHMRFDTRIESMTWQEAERLWYLRSADGRVFSACFVITAIGVLSRPTLPDYPGMEDFAGESFHTFYWPENVPLAGRRVGVMGTGATGIQVIAEIAGRVGELKVFQRRPNWSTPLNNSPISESEMAAIRADYDNIFARCAASQSGFEHTPHPRGFWEVTREERLALWDHLYEQPGFAMLAGNFPEIFFDEAANREVSDYVAGRIRKRVKNQAVAEKLIPRDHGFGTQRLPLETRYFEAYNLPQVELVDISATPIKRFTSRGVETTRAGYDLDLMVYATGFDAITGAFDSMEIRGAGGRNLADKWQHGPRTWMGMLTQGFPNLLMVAGPQSVSGSTNFPRAIEGGVNWITDLLEYLLAKGHTRVEVRPEAEAAWVTEVVRAHERLLLHRSKGWFTGYNSNVAGRTEGRVRYQAYFGGAPRYMELADSARAAGYPDLSF